MRTRRAILNPKAPAPSNDGRLARAAARCGYDRTPQDVRDAAHAQDDAIAKTGALVAIAGRPVQVRNPGARGVERVEGAYMKTELPVAGFSVIEAVDLDEAVRMVSGVPCAVAHGVVEVWPLEQPRQPD